VTDSDGAPDSASINVTIEAVPVNTPPEVTITAPASGSTFDEGESIGFTATATDAEDNNATLTAAISWSSNVDGALGTGGSINVSTLSAGPHQITAAVTDSDGAPDSASINVTIEAVPVNTPPEVTITAPSSGSSFDEGESIGFTATATDAEDNNATLTAAISWTSNVDGALGTGGSINVSTLSAGSHQITAAVTDSDGAPDSASINVTIATTATFSINDVAADEGDSGTSTFAFTVTLSNAVTGGANVSYATANGTATTGDADYAATSGTLSFTGTAGETRTINVTVNGDTTVEPNETFTVSLSNPTNGVTLADAQGVGTITNDDSAVSARPNILFILADDMGADSSEIYPWLQGDNGQVPTPTLSALAADGVIFRNAWANPVCSPTRGTFISGLYGHQTGVLTVGNRLPVSTTSIFEYITSSSPESYAMAGFGKWHIGNNVSHVQNGTGLPVFRGFLGGFIADYYNWQVVGTDQSTAQTTTYATTALTDFAIEFIANHESSPSANDPWFVYVPYNAPHGTEANDGFQVPPSNLHSVNLADLGPPGTYYYGSGPGSNSAAALRVYRAMIQAMDTEIGRLLNAIGPPGSPERDNTVVIFMGDNGTPPSVQDSNVGVRDAKSTVYEGGVRVPLVIAGAGVTRNGAEEEHIVVSSDLYATIAQLAGIPVSQIYNSYSLVPLLTSNSASSGRQYAFTELCNRNAERYAVRGDRWKLLYSNGTWGMYDLVLDSLETTNVYTSDNPTIAAERAILQAELAALAAAAPFGCFE
jgi:arylsulfatase A-like enzyme